MTLALALTVMMAGAIGAVLRWLLSRALPVAPGRLPGGILIVNVVGSATAGFVIGLAERAAIDDALQLVLVTGFCGGLTTFSTWSVETVELFDGGRWRSAIINIVATLGLGLLTAAGAYVLAR